MLVCQTLRPFPPVISARASECRKQKFTGLGQNFQDGSAVWLKIPIRGLKLGQILGQPCEICLRGARAALRTHDESKTSAAPALRQPRKAFGIADCGSASSSCAYPSLRKIPRCSVLSGPPESRCVPGTTELR